MGLALSLLTCVCSFAHEESDENRAAIAHPTHVNKHREISGTTWLDWGYGQGLTKVCDTLRLGYVKINYTIEIGTEHDQDTNR